MQPVYLPDNTSTSNSVGNPTYNLFWKSSALTVPISLNRSGAQHESIAPLTSMVSYAALNSELFDDNQISVSDMTFLGKVSARYLKKRSAKKRRA